MILALMEDILIDTHCHLDEEAFDEDCGDVVRRAADAGVKAVITIGTTAESSRRAVELAASFDSVFAAVGIQPNHVAQSKRDDWKTIEELATHPKVVAIGETGLDRYWDYTPFEQQVESFARHIELARQQSLPFIVHCRDAEADVVSHLRAAASSGPLRAVMHSFCGTSETAQACLELGLYVSFSGMVTYKKNKELRVLAAKVPSDRILIETDAPYLSPTPKRGQRNEPAYVRHTAACLAQARGISLEEIATMITRNAQTLFGLPPMV